MCGCASLTLWSPPTWQEDISDESELEAAKVQDPLSLTTNPLCLACTVATRPLPFTSILIFKPTLVCTKMQAEDEDEGKSWKRENHSFEEERSALHVPKEGGWAAAAGGGTAGRGGQGGPPGAPGQLCRGPSSGGGPGAARSDRVYEAGWGFPGGRAGGREGGRWRDDTDGVLAGVGVGGGGLWRPEGTWQGCVDVGSWQDERDARDRSDQNNRLRDQAQEHRQDPAGRGYSVGGGVEVEEEDEEEPAPVYDRVGPHRQPSSSLLLLLA